MTYFTNYPTRQRRQIRHAGFHENYPAVNISEKEEGWTLSLAVPGLGKEDFSIGVEKDRLTISHEDKGADEENDKGYTRREFGFRAFKRSFILPDSVDAAKIKASYQQGVLTLHTPKKEEAKLLSIEIEVN